MTDQSERREGDGSSFAEAMSEQGADRQKKLLQAADDLRLKMEGLAGEICELILAQPPVELLAYLGPALEKLSSSRKSMTKYECADTIIAAIQNYGHAATHSESRNGELEYSRADAKLMISLAASLAEFHFNQK